MPSVGVPSPWLAIRFAWRSRFFLGEIILVLVISILVAAVMHGGVRSTVYPTGALSAAGSRQFINAVFTPWQLAGFLIALILGAAVIPNEIRRGRSIMFLAGPLSRERFLVHCWAAASLLVATHFLVGVLGGAIAVKAVLGITPPMQYWVLAAGTITRALALVAITLCYSTRFSPAVAAPLGFATMVVPSWLHDFSDHPSVIVRTLVKAVVMLAPPIGRSVASDGLLTTTRSPVSPRSFYVIADCLCYAAIALCVAGLLFRRKDIGVGRA